MSTKQRLSASVDAELLAAAQQAVTGANVLERVPDWDWSPDPKTDFQQTFEAEGRPTFRARWVKRG